MLAKSISGAAAAVQPAFIEDVFSTYLYTGNGSTQTITNGIDLSGKGGLVWIKGRSGATGHRFTDTSRGATKSLESNSTAAEVTESTGLTAFGSTGFTIGADADYNTSTATYVSWAFRKQAKFFDVVTYTGTGAVQNIAHSLGSTPGCIIVKCTSNADNWGVWHRSLNNSTGYLLLNSTAASGTSTSLWGNTAPTSTTFTVGNNGITGASGFTYVAYLFAHNAGGFGLTGTDNVISCGSYVGTGAAGNNVTLGWEPQFLLIKGASTGATGSWEMIDNMRGMSLGSNAPYLRAESSNAEASTANLPAPTATGFVSKASSSNTTGETYIYIAIRRGPMRVPTSGTSVYNAQTPTPTGVDNRKYTGVGFPLDAIFLTHRTGGGFGTWIEDRLRGAKKPLYSYATTAEDGFGQGSTQGPASFDQDGWTGGSGDSGQWDYNVGYTNVFHYFRRAPGFFDVVNNASGSPMPHNLGVTPELIITKVRNFSPQDWFVFAPSILPLNGNDTLELNTTDAAFSTNYITSVSSTSISTSLGSSTYPYIYYLFATCPGVSKVGSYTGTGTTKQIDCGFTGGARFVLIKRTDSTGDWYVWDTARGIVAGNDPYLLLNSTAAEVTSTDYIDTYPAGFEISSTAPAAINANGGTFIFLAIA